jgi:hypothetical protein
LRKPKPISRKKIIFLLTLNCFLLSFTWGQIPIPEHGEDYHIENFKTRIIEIKPSNTVIKFTHVDSILINDARPDTLSVGLTQQNSQKPFFLVFSQDFATELVEFVNAHTVYGRSNSLSVVMVIKKFWISGGLDNDMNEHIRKTGYADTIAEKLASLQVRIEFFLKKDTDYYALFRFDSTFSKNIIVSRNASGLIPEAVEAALTKLSEMDAELPTAALKRRKFSWQEIEAHNLKRFDIPILKDTTLVPGVYLSFQEFKENNPSQREYEVGKDKLTDMVFIKGSDGKMTPTRFSWGYCDGKNLFIKSRDNYFRLQRRGNAFYTYASREYKRKKVVYIPGLAIISSATVGGPATATGPAETNTEHYTLKLKPFELDWESGELK